jgi:hypothetical protein
MNIKNLFLLSCIASMLASCSHVYTPALYHQDIAYQPKPTSFDTAKTANYISIGMNNYLSTNFHDALVSGQISLSRAHVFDNFNVSYGGFGVFGDYQNSTSSSELGKPTNFNDKFFGAVGARASANAFTTNGRVDWRFIGFEAAYSHEFGSFANFRQSLYNQGGYYVDPRTVLFTIGLTTEVIFHNVNNPDIQHGIRGFIGTTLGHNALDDTYYTDQSATNKFYRDIFPKASYFIRVKKYFGVFEIGENVFFARVGLRF